MDACETNLRYQLKGTSPVTRSLSYSSKGIRFGGKKVKVSRSRGGTRVSLALPTSSEAFTGSCCVTGQRWWAKLVVPLTFKFNMVEGQFNCSG